MCRHHLGFRAQHDRQWYHLKVLDLRIMGGILQTKHKRVFRHTETRLDLHQYDSDC